MKKLGVLLLASSTLLPFVGNSFAQLEPPNTRGLVEMSGDPDSFGANMKFMGVTFSGTVFLDPTCEFPPGEGLGPEDRCVVLSGAPGQTPFNVRDIGRITLPANASRSVLFMMTTNWQSYQFFNTTGVPQSSAVFRYDPYLTIESEAFNDPRALDPATGAPLNGKIDVGGWATLVDRSLAVDERIRQSSNYSRTSVNSLSKSYWRDNGLPEDLVNGLFHGPITIRLNVKGRARLLSDGFMQYSIRIFGD
jgi:hypothetical protein